MASSRWARWGIVVATLVTATALSAASWSSFARTRDTSKTLIRGQGQLLLESATVYLRALRRPPEQSDLKKLLTSLRSRGMRFLSFRGPFAEHVSVGDEVGGATETDAPPPRGTPLSLTRIGSIVRLQVHLPGPLRDNARGDGPPHRRRPPPGIDDGRRPPRGIDDGRRPPRGIDDGRRPRPPRGIDGRPPRPPVVPPLVFEFEPVLANELVADAKRSFVLSVATSAIMLVAAFIAFILLRRREQAEEQLARERHLATLGEMSAVLAHELRNPLASLKGHAQLLAETLPEDGKPKQKADRVVREAIRLENLTSDLLEFVRTGKIDPQPTDPATTLRTAVNEVAPERIDTNTQQAPRKWLIDSDRMQQVLTNLLRNAVQASPDNARVTASVAAEDGGLVFEVSDTGAGITPGEEAAIFEPFRTSRVHGTGLGLAVAKRVVELHGGTIAAHNRTNGGATFRIHLPGKDT